jgi:CDP-4-dehydro-6-deoxyglucose reductase
VDDINACHAYLCGPPGMVDSAIAVLKGRGVGDERIFYDKFTDASHQPGQRAASA